MTIQTLTPESERALGQAQDDWDALESRRNPRFQGISRMIDDVQVAGKTCVLCGLFSVKDKGYEEQLEEAQSAIHALGGRIVARLVQRRGVSRSSKPGGSRLLDQPLNSRLIFSSGKFDELKSLAEDRNADVIIFYNSLTSAQHANLARALSREIMSYLDDLSPKDNS